MKKLILFSFLLLSASCFCENNIEILESTFPEYKGIISFIDKSSNEIYSQAKKNNYIILSDIKLDEKNKIVVSAIKNFSYSQTISHKTINIGGTINYTLTIDIKDGKLRYFISVIDVHAGLVSMLGYLKEKPKDMVSVPILIEVEKFKNELIKSLSDLKEQKQDNW